MLNSGTIVPVRSELSLFEFASGTSQEVYAIPLDTFEFVRMPHPSVESNDGI